MDPARVIYEDTPAYIPIPEDFRHRKIEVIFRLLEDASGVSERRRTPPASLAGKARDHGDVMSTIPAVDWEADV